MKAAAFLSAMLLVTAAQAQEHVHEHAPPAAQMPGPHAQDKDAAPPPGDVAPPPAAPSQGRVLYYRDPMGGTDTSPVPKKDSMGMDYIPVYENQQAPTINDHAADRVFDPAAMAAARGLLRREHGGELTALVLVNIFEYQARKGGDGYRWEGEGWYGGDIHRAVVKAKGEGIWAGALDEAELQALYSRAIDPYFNLQAGLRYDVRPDPSRAYATLGIEGLAPYWFEVSAALFVSHKGDLHARLEGYYDLNLTQRLILQPRAEIDVAAQKVPELRTGAGISTFEAELRLRYEIRREFAPYVGVSFERKLGQTANLARSAGDRASATSVVAGMRFLF